MQTAKAAKAQTPHPARLPTRDDPATVAAEAISKSIIRQKGIPGDRLLETLYTELHALAHARMRRLPPNQTLQPTALLHEAFIKLGGSDQKWENEAHFFGAAARAMRNIMVDQARRKGAVKHGGDRHRTTFNEQMIAAASKDAPLPDLDDALRRLEAEDPRKAEVVNLRFFAGLTVDQIAACTGMSKATIERDWAYAREWLKRDLRKNGSDESA